MRSLDDLPDDGAGRVVVALDGSPSSVRALRHGARIASALGLSLKVVTVWHRSDLGGDAMAEPARATQSDAVAVVFGASPPAGLERRVLEGATVPTLLSESRSAEMLVLGSRGRGGFAGLLLGSVSAACAAHASCAVLVCRAEVAAEPRHRPGAPRGEIVVGVDGTVASTGALRQGAQFAESMHLPLHAICASGGGIPSAADASAVLSTASQQVFGDAPPRWFRSSVRDGAPAMVLGRASEHARMLIIGHSGGRAPTTSRESVSSAIALEAICPVVIFHSTHARRPETLDGSIA